MPARFPPTRRCSADSHCSRSWRRIKRNPTCAGCHTRIDPLGFPLERYDAMGRWRESYSDGKPVHDSSTLADKTPIAGVDGLLEYLKSTEQAGARRCRTSCLGMRWAHGSCFRPAADRAVDREGATSLFRSLRRRSSRASSSGTDVNARKVTAAPQTATAQTTDERIESRSRIRMKQRSRVAPSLFARRGRSAGAALDGIVPSTAARKAQSRPPRQLRTSRRFVSPPSTSPMASSRFTGGQKAAAPSMEFGPVSSP